MVTRGEKLTLLTMSLLQLTTRSGSVIFANGMGVTGGREKA